MSTGVQYSGAPNKISGALYHKVTTYSVYGLIGTEYVLARPKSAIFKFIVSSNKIFEGFKSLWIILFECIKAVAFNN